MWFRNFVEYWNMFYMIVLHVLYIESKMEQCDDSICLFCCWLLQFSFVCNNQKFGFFKIRNGVLAFLKSCNTDYKWQNVTNILVIRLG